MKIKIPATVFVLGLIAVFLPSTTWCAPQKVGALGRIKPGKGIVAIAVPSGSTIMAVHVKRGDTVKKGAPLLAVQDVASISGKVDAELAEMDLKEAKTSTRMAIDIKKIEVEIAKMEYEHAAMALQRLLSGGAETYSAQTKEDREHLLRTSKSRLDAAIQELNRLENERESRVAKAQLKFDAARKRLQQAVITAPVDGTVLEILQEPGDAGGAGAALKIADLRQIDVVVEVFEGDVLKLSPGLKTSITSKALPKPLSGKIISIGQIVNMQSRNAEVIIRLDNPGVAAKLINHEVNVSIELK